MGDSPRVRRFAPEEWRTYRDLRLRALAESPDAFGSTLGAERERPDVDWARRLAAAAHAPGELPLVASVGDRAVGLAWGRIRAEEPAVAHLFQVWVAPEHRGRGAGQLRLDTVVAWASAAGARYLDLDVAGGDSPATRLYARAGFRPAGAPKPLRPGSSLLVQPLRLALGAATAPSA